MCGEQVHLHRNKKLVNRSVFTLPLFISIGTKFKAGLIESIPSHKPVLILDTNYLQTKEGISKVLRRQLVKVSLGQDLETSSHVESARTNKLRTP